MTLTAEYAQTIAASSDNPTRTAVRHFALVLTNNPELSRWQVHNPQCADASQMRERGAFVDYVSAQCPELLVKNELHLYSLTALQEAWTEQDFQVMPCCKGVDARQN
jgi:hypothetical protein